MADVGPRFWGLDPIFSARIKLNIVDVLSLETHPDFPEVYYILDHPVLGVNIMGDVVSIQKKSRFLKYEVDDGTGVLTCTQWRHEDDSDRDIFIPKLGSLVSVWGKLSEFRNAKQLTITTISEETDPNSEPLHWLEVAHLKKTVYSSPFSLPPCLLNDCSELKTSLRYTIQQTVLDFLKKSYTGKHFTLRDISSNTVLRSSCLGSVSGGGNAEEEVMREFSSLVQELPRIGVIIPAMGVGKQKETVYEIFLPKKHLCPVILEYIRRKEKSESAERLGVPEKWILEFIKQRDRFCQLPTTVTTDALEELVKGSHIYLYNTKAYKTIK